MSDDVLPHMNENWVAWLESFAPHVSGVEIEGFGSIRAVSVGAPMPLFNQAFVFEPPAAEDVRNAADWLAGRGVPFQMTTPAHLASGLAPLAGDAGLADTGDRVPGMALASLDAVSGELPPGLEVVRTTEPNHLDAVAVAISDGFGPPVEAARHLSPDSVLGDDANVYFAGYLDGEPTACAQLFRTGGVAGVYSVAVCEQFRRRGLGQALTAAALVAGRDDGCRVGILQASAMGKPVYDRMGFETITEYHLFTALG